MLASEAQKLKKRDERKSRPDLSAYLENEAAESDEDAFGFAKPKNAEDDEDGEDLDATLEELMDDKELDQSAIAPDLVHAKFMFVIVYDILFLFCLILRFRLKGTIRSRRPGE